MKNLLDLKNSPSLKRLSDIEREFWGEIDARIGGMFVIRSEVDGGALRAIAANDDGWDHVSVSRTDRCPSWAEMEQVKRLFFKPSETAFQLHVPDAEHINVHSNCLHLWRPHNQPIPRPPSIMV